MLCGLVIMLLLKFINNRKGAEVVSPSRLWVIFSLGLPGEQSWTGTFCHCHPPWVITSLEPTITPANLYW